MTIIHLAVPPRSGLSGVTTLTLVAIPWELIVRVGSDSKGIERSRFQVHTGWRWAVGLGAVKAAVHPGGGRLRSWTGMFNRETWAELKPAVKPSPRFAATAVYDQARRFVVLFGGSNEQVCF
jgi:hypothetical protein